MAFDNTSILDVRAILSELGYTNLRRDGKGYRITAKWRNGDNPTSILVYDNGYYCDFATGDKGNIYKLISLSSGLNYYNSKQWLQNNNFNEVKLDTSKPSLKMIKTYPAEYLNYIKQDYSYPESRGISHLVCKELQCGVVGNVKGKLKNRFVFPIFNLNKELVGFTGRSLNGTIPKYLHQGEKSEWIWPLFTNLTDIKEKNSIILVESPFDACALMTSGIRNVACLFGVDLGLGLLNICLRYEIKKILISTNNDEINGGTAGNEAAQKIYKRLSRYFDSDNLEIKLPSQKDWNEVLINNGREEVRKSFEN